MQKKVAAWLLAMLLLHHSLPVLAQKTASWQLQSPNGKITVTINAAAGLTWSVVHERTTVLAPSAIAITLANGEVLGSDLSGASTKASSMQSASYRPDRLHCPYSRNAQFSLAGSGDQQQ